MGVKRVKKTGSSGGDSGSDAGNASDPPRPGESSSPLRKAIESHSRQLNLTRLLRERKKVRAIPMEVLESIMCEAIANVVLNGDIDPLLDQASIREQAKNELRRLIQDHQEGRTSEERNDVDTLRHQVEQLKEELDRQRSELDTERELTPEEIQEREVDKLQRRISKLNKALEASENALQMLAKEKSIDPGVASIYADFQGLAQDDAKFQEKRDMIQVVFVNNLRLMKREVTADDLDGVEEQFLLDLPDGVKTGSGTGTGTSTGSGNGSGTGAGSGSGTTGTSDKSSGGMTFRKPVDLATDETSF